MSTKINGAWLTTNRSCNNHCEWCYAQHAQHAQNRHMEINDAKKCVDILQELGVWHITLIGGEPTIYSGFLELVSYISERQIKVSVATNGRQFSNLIFAQNIIKAGISGVNISIKALSEDNYYELTGSSGFQEMLCGYKNLKSLGFSPTLSYVITECDEKQIDDIINLMVEQKMDNIIFQFVKPVIEVESAPIMDMNDMGKMVGVIYDKMIGTTLKYKIEISFPLCFVDKGICDKLIMEDKIVTCCHVQSGRGIVFDTDFSVLPCNHFVDMPFSKKTVGLLSAKAINELWLSEEVQEFRERSQYYPSEKCALCDKWNQCGGGCFTRWFFVNPKDIL